MIFADDEREANPTNFKFVLSPVWSPFVPLGLVADSNPSFRSSLIRLLQMAHAWKQAQAGAGGLLDEDDSDEEEEDEEEDEAEGAGKDAEMAE